MGTLHTSLQAIINKAGAYLKTDLAYVIKGGFWINSNLMVGSLVGFALSIVFANVMPKEIFGMYRYILAVTSVVAAFSLTGMNVAVTRAVAQGFDGMFKRALKEQFLWSWPQVVALLAFSGYYFFQGNTAYGLVFFATSILAPLSGIANTYHSFLNGKKDFYTSSFYGFWTNILYFVVMAVILWFTPQSLIMVTIGYYSITTLANVIFCLRTYKKYNAAAYDSARNEDISYGKHISLMNVIGTLASQLDNVLVYHLLGPVSLAIYSFATAVPERIRSLFGFISNIAFPKIAEKKESAIGLSFGRKILQLCFLAIVVSLVYILTAPFIFRFLFPEYLASIAYSQVFSLSLLAIASNISFTGLLAQRRQTELYYINTVVPVLKIILTVIGIWYLGIWGAVIARIAGHLLLFGGSTYFLLRTRAVTAVEPAQP